MHLLVTDQHIGGPQPAGFLMMDDLFGPCTQPARRELRWRLVHRLVHVCVCVHVRMRLPRGACLCRMACMHGKTAVLMHRPLHQQAAWSHGLDGPRACHLSRPALSGMDRNQRYQRQSVGSAFRGQLRASSTAGRAHLRNREVLIIAFCCSAGCAHSLARTTHGGRVQACDCSNTPRQA